MKFLVTFALCLAAAGASAQEPGQIRVGCHRYISTEIIWDKPSDNFVSDLRAVGYDPVDAFAVATTLCRDPATWRAARRLRRDFAPSCGPIRRARPTRQTSSAASEFVFAAVTRTRATRPSMLSGAWAWTACR